LKLKQTGGMKMKKRELETKDGITPSKIRIPQSKIRIPQSKIRIPFTLVEL
jgi:hypothetical protein